MTQTQVSSVEGANSLVLQEAVAKQFRDCMKGGNGVAGLMMFLDQVMDLVPEIQPLRVQYKNDLTWFETALAKCGKEKLARPAREREEDLFKFMGFHCVKCGCRVSQMGLRETGRTCVRCEIAFSSVYSDIYRKLLRTYRVDASPEAVLMFEAYDRRAEAVCLLFEAVRKVAVWLDLFLDERTAYYFEQIFFGVVPGEGKLASEVKQGLQFLARGNFARDADGRFVVDLAKADQLIQLSFEVVKWGYLSNSLQVTGVEDAYNKADLEYGAAYSVLNGLIRQANFSMRQEVAKPKVEIVELPDDKKQYYPYVVLPQEYWESGRLPKQYKLYPFTKPDIYPKVSSPSIDIWYGLPGAGKTLGMTACASDGIVNHSEFVIQTLSDKSNALCLASLPMFGYDLRTNNFVKRLKDMGVPQRGIPTLTLTFLQNGEEIKSPEDANPPTIWDRVVFVEDFRNFAFDWEWAVDELKKIALEYGIEKPKGISEKKWVPPGIINIRNLYRLNMKTKENFDVQVALCLLPQFDSFRKNNLSTSCRLFCDELSQIAPSTSNSSDTYDSGILIKETIKDIRRDNASLDGSTQQITDVNTEIRNNVRNLFARNLPKTGDKSHSQLDIVLSSFQLEDDAVIPIVKALNDKGRLHKGFFWFWLNFDHVPRKIDIVQFSPPVFTINDPDKTNREVFELYQKASDAGECQKVSEIPILLPSWEKVPWITMPPIKFGRETLSS